MTELNAHPEQIGPYRIVQIIGEGGMGIVFHAEQKEPIRRRVALKMMRAGLDPKKVMARFEAERQALAVLEHPGIAKVFDAGTTRDGRPYFVMELVRGLRLDEYANMNRLTLRERVQLVIDICRAVQHAHQKGIIHRDLKPSNVLVTDEDGPAAITVIDFGIAKATGQQLTEHTALTTHGQALGTLTYMSPEQAEMSGLDVDTRTDIYSLGVVLFELLAGVPPMDPTEVGVPGFLARLTQREEPTTRLSNAISTLDRTRLDNVLSARRTTEVELKRALAGDLQWITLKATEKERARRYDSAAGLAADLERYLADEPVSARAPTARYRVGKFIRRNRAATAAALTAVVALMGGTIAATAAMVQARAAEGEARAAEEQAQLEAETATQVTDFLTGLFATSDPTQARGNEVTARELLDRGAERIRDELAEQPALQARLMLTMGDAYTSMFLVDEGMPLVQESVELSEAAFGPDARETLRSVMFLADRYRAFCGRQAYDVCPDAAERGAWSDTAYVRAERALPRSDSLYMEALKGYVAWDVMAKEPDRDSLMSAVVEELEQELGEAHGLIARLRTQHQDALRTASDRAPTREIADSLTLRREALIRRNLELDPNSEIALNNMSVFLVERGRFEEGVEYMVRVIEQNPPDDPAAFIQTNNAATTFHLIGRPEEARRYGRLALEDGRRFFSLTFAEPLAAVGFANAQLGEHLAAVEQLEAVVSGADSVSSTSGASYQIDDSSEPLRATFPDIWVTFGLASAYAGLDRIQDSVRMLERSFRFATPARPTSRRLLARYHEDAAELARSIGRVLLADRHDARVLELREGLDD